MIWTGVPTGRREAAQRCQVDHDSALPSEFTLQKFRQVPATAQLLDDAVVRNGLANHWRESYVCETRKSMKSMGLGGSSESLLA